MNCLNVLFISVNVIRFQIKFPVVTVYTVDRNKRFLYDHLHEKSFRNFVKDDIVSVYKICISACLNVE